MIKKEYHLRKSKDTKEELDDIYGLWQECFGDTGTYMDFYFKHIIPRNVVLSLYDGNEIVSMLHLNPYKLSIKGNYITANYIVGVATKSSHRKRGLMRNLMEESFHQMYKEKQSITYLMPIAKEIYEPFDFSIVYEQESWNYQMLQATSFLIKDEKKGIKEFSDGIVIEVINNEKSMDTKQMIEYKEALAQFANEVLSNEYDVYVPRTKEYYDILLDEVLCCGGGILILKQGDEILGYTAYMFDDMFHVVELLCRDDYKERLLQEVNQIYVKGNTGKSDNINTFQTTIMMRIIHFEEFIKNITSSERLSLIIEVEDKIIIKNNGIYLLEFDKDKGRLTRVSEKPQVKVNAKQLVDLFFNRMNKEEMQSIIVTEDKLEMLRKLNMINKYNKVFINDVV